MKQMAVSQEEKNQILIVTGLSGAGKSSALRQFEDMGWEIADNVPLSLLGPMIQQSVGTGRVNLALGIDLRTRGFSTADILELMQEVKETDQESIELVYLDCDEAVLQRRFTETRRRHPLAKDRPVGDGIKQEKSLLSALKQNADLRIDTTNLSLPELKRILTGHFSLHETSRLSVSIMSFSYKYGVPREADLMFDVRFLQNPYYEDNLRRKSGQDEDVVAFVEQDRSFDPFFSSLSNMLELLLPRYAEEGKSYLTIAIGCTGGRHRSVCVAEKIHDLVANSGYFVNLTHRDLKKSEGN
ncbi:MAG: RNase adapter RapZ [Proteobacteria bacterium]|nr:RNase adapter RapZ [Pseudomonadota bacterium]